MQKITFFEIVPFYHPSTSDLNAYIHFLTSFACSRSLLPSSLHILTPTFTILHLLHARGQSKRTLSKAVLGILFLHILSPNFLIRELHPYFFPRYLNFFFELKHAALET
mmetsp:Transcript_23009/g.52687  ORF Transcript_23009/g.52687 Transcript_23009/m.52687 type:complete len:109 (-) Transcript_23009:551-877(-)